MTDPAGSPVGPAGGVSEPGSPAGVGADDLTEVVVESEVLRRGHYLTFRIDTIERADGTRAKREVVGHPGAVAILAIDEADNVLMVRQFRIPAGRALLEVPAGTLDVDPLTGAIEDPAVAAPRELEEETGCRAGSWRLLTSFWTAPGFATEYMHLYLATDLQPAHDDRLGPDEDERLQLERVPWQEAIDRAERGEIADAKSLIALLWLDRLTQPSAVTATAPSAPADAEVPPGEQDLLIRFDPSLRDTIRASITYARRSPAPTAMGFVGLFLAIALGVTGNSVLAILFGIVGFMLITGVASAGAASLAYWRRPAALRGPVEFGAGSAGVSVRNSTVRSHLDWSAFTRLRESSGHFFLEAGRSVVWLPKGAMSSEQVSTLRRLIAEAGFGPDGRRR